MSTMSSNARAIANKTIGKVEVKVGDNVLGIGLDDYCLPCITYLFIEERNADGTYTIRTRDAYPIRIIFNNLDSLYPDNLQNRTIIRNACKQVCHEHFAAVDKQLKSINK